MFSFPVFIFVCICFCGYQSNHPRNKRKSGNCILTLINYICDYPEG